MSDKTTLKQENTIEYPVVSALRRASAGVLDYIFVSILAFLLSLLVFINSNFKISDIFVNNDELAPEPWRLFLMAIIAFFVYCTYYIIIPLFCKSYTLFRWAFSIRMISLVKQNDKKKLFIALIKHSLLTWLIFIIINLLAMGFCFVFADASFKSIEAMNEIELKKYYHQIKDLKAYVQSILSLKINDNFTNTTTMAILSILVKSLYSIMGLVSCIIVIHMFMNSKKRALHDQVAKVVLLWMHYEKPKQTPKHKTKREVEIQKINNLIQELDKI